VLGQETQRDSDPDLQHQTPAGTNTYLPKHMRFLLLDATAGTVMRAIHLPELRPAPLSQVTPASQDTAHMHVQGNICMPTPLH
jgi:hypothetical protein